MHHWLFLSGAILFEVAGTISMKLSDGFTRPIPSVLIFVFYIVSFVALTFALEKIEVSKKDVASVGDTSVDIPLFQRSKLGIAVNTDDKNVIEKADYHLEEKDLRELIPIIIN